MNNQTQTSILEINKKNIVEITNENIVNIVTNTINNNSVLVTSTNNIKFEHIKISNTKGKIEINQKNANCLMIDEEFNNEMNTNISKTYITSFYNEIVKNVKVETLEEINKNLNNSLNNSYTSKDYVSSDINDYIDIQNKLYVNVFNKIHNVISNSKITENINSCITKVKQYNYIGVKDVKFGSSEHVNESAFNKRKTKINVLFNQKNTSDMLIKCVASTEEITDILDNIVNELSTYEPDSIHQNIGKKDKDLDEKNLDEKNLDEKLDENKTSNNIKIILIVVACVIVLIILIIVFVLIFKHKTNKEDKNEK